MAQRQTSQVDDWVDVNDWVDVAAPKSRGASGEWEWSPEELPTVIRLPAKGLAQLGEGAANIPKGLLGLAKTAWQTLGADPADLAPEELTSYIQFGMPGVLAHRLTIGPQLEQAKLAMESIPSPSPASTIKVPTSMGMGSIPIPLEGLKRVGHAAAALVPFVGPWAASLAETAASPSYGGEGKPLKAIGELGTGMLLPKVVKGGAKYIREAPVRKGYTTLDPVTLRPTPPEPPILVKHGLPAPEIPKGKIPTYELPTQQIADGLGLLDDVEGTQMKNAIAEIYPDLKYAQAHAPGVRGAVNTPAKLRALLDWNGDRIWSSIMEPELKQSGMMQNLANLSNDVRAELPEHVKVFYDELVDNKLNPIQRIIDSYKRPGEAIPRVDPMMFHGFAKAIRTELDLAPTPMQQALERQTPRGELLFTLNKVLRDKLYDHVETTRKFDMRPIARKYGMNAVIKGEAADLTTPKGFFESLFSSYTFPTPRAITARIGETAGKQMMNRLKSLNRGFSHKMTPAEEALVARPAPPTKPVPAPTFDGKPIPKRGSYIQRGPDPDIAPAPEPPPGPTAVIYNWTGQTPKGEVFWPAPTKPGQPQKFGQGSTPQWTGQPGKPGEFFPGKQGQMFEDSVTGKPVTRKDMVRDPKTGDLKVKGTDHPVVRVDYRNQQQLFSIEQSPPPRWKPTEHLTSMLSDLIEMRDEIVRYLVRAKPTGSVRQDYINDVKALQAEIYRRQEARKVGRKPYR